VELKRILKKLKGVRDVETPDYDFNEEQLKTLVDRTRVDPFASFDWIDAM